MRSEWRQNGVTRGNVWFYSWGNGIILGEDSVDKYEFVEEKDENISNRWY